MKQAEQDATSLATAVGTLADSGPIAAPGNNHVFRTGRALLDGVECQYGNLVRPDDLVAADFDRRDVHTGGGLYLLVMVQGGRIAWRGCRQLMRVPDGFQIDVTGWGERTTIPELPEGWQVVGTVEKVYRPVRAV